MNGAVEKACVVQYSRRTHVVVTSSAEKSMQVTPPASAEREPHQRSWRILSVSRCLGPFKGFYVRGQALESLLPSMTVHGVDTKDSRVARIG